MIICSYCLHNDYIINFIKWNENVLQEFNIELIVISDKNIIFNNQNYKCFIYPIIHKPMSKSRILNYGIKNTTNRDIIFSFDIDIVISREALMKSIELIESGVGVSFQVGNIDSYDNISKLDWKKKIKKRLVGYGMTGMSYSDWDKLNGYDERMYGWGFEDTDLHKRSCRIIKMHRLIDYPVYHINHADRTVTGSLFEHNNLVNGAISEMGRWECKKWGEEKFVDYVFEYKDIKHDYIDEKCNWKCDKWIECGKLSNFHGDRLLI